MSCSVEGCTGKVKARGLCRRHYMRAYTAGTLGEHPRIRDVGPNPLICLCPEPVADPRKDYGMCQICKRKPVALMHGRFAPKGTAA